MLRGVEKHFADFDRCIPFFAETSSCAICIADCPWPRPGVGLNLAEKMAHRRERDETSENIVRLLVIGRTACRLSDRRLQPFAGVLRRATQLEWMR